MCTVVADDLEDVKRIQMKISAASVGLFMALLHPVQLLAQQTSPDETAHWGISASLGGAAGGIGLSILSLPSENWTLLAGIGYWPSFEFPFQLVISENQPIKEHRTELSVFICSRYFVSQWFYLLGGVGARRVEGSLAGYGHESKVTLGSVGIPMGIGFELGDKTSFGVNFEMGYSTFIGPGADDIKLHVPGFNSTDDIKTTIEGSSGLLIGLGINIYF